jgi:hypothetical protein
MMLRQDTSRDANTHASVTLPCSPQARRRHNRLCWIIVIVGLLLVANILATVNGLGKPLYGAFHPAAAPAASATHTTTQHR